MLKTVSSIHPLHDNTSWISNDPLPFPPHFWLSLSLSVSDLCCSCASHRLHILNTIFEKDTKKDLLTWPRLEFLVARYCVAVCCVLCAMCCVLCCTAFLPLPLPSFLPSFLSSPHSCVAHFSRSASHCSAPLHTALHCDGCSDGYFDSSRKFSSIWNNRASIGSYVRTSTATATATATAIASASLYISLLTADCCLLIYIIYSVCQSTYPSTILQNDLGSFVQELDAEMAARKANPHAKPAHKRYLSRTSNEHNHNHKSNRA